MKNRIGFVISGKENEKRRAILPKHLATVTNKDHILIERGYGAVLGICDARYQEAGARVVDKEEAYSAEIICNPKNPLKNEYDFYHTGQTLFGWIHAVQGRQIVDFLLERSMTAIAWEDMFYPDSHHVFWRNNEIAGEAAVLHALQYVGLLPEKLNVAVVGKGNTARGAVRVLDRLGARVTVYDRKRAPYLRNEIWHYDVVVNAVMWDVFRTDHIIYREDLMKMKHGAIIIDISCDESMGIETSHPTTINDPVYEIDGVLHYAVDHTPTIFFSSASESISQEVSTFLDDLICKSKNPILESATIIANGCIIDERIIQYQNRLYDMSSYERKLR